MFPNNVDSPEQERVLGQLKELFVTCPPWEIRQACIRNNWNLDLCVNYLMNFTPAEEKDQRTNTSRTTNTNKPSNEDTMLKKEAIIVKDTTVDEERIGGLIKSGYRLMILMRGPPGVGKSFAAKLLVTKYVDLQPPHNKVNDFVFSSDDYFQNSQGAYKYNVKLLSEAHEFNQKRVRENAVAGLSPIIVDNTNMQVWEMMPYVQAAVQNGYLIEIVEPKTSWHNCVYKLSQRNKHGVPANKIRRMIEKYEKAEPADLLKMLKNTKYRVSIPMLRALPPIPLSNKDIELEANAKRDSVPLAIQDEDGISSWGTYEENVPKEQRKNIKSKVSREVQKEFIDVKLKSDSCSNQPTKSATARDVYSLLEKKLTNVWKPYEVESVDFWDKTQTSEHVGPQIAIPVQVGSKNNAVTTLESNSLLDLLRSETGKDEHKETNIIKKKIFDCHSVGCPYENSAFATLRQMYPNKQPSGLWDLFQKCNGDIDWAVDILLKEDELSRLRKDDEIKFDSYDTDELVCSCDCQQRNTNKGTDLNFLPLQTETLKNVDLILNTRDAKQPMTRAQRTRFIRHNTMYNPELREIDESLKKQFVLSDDNYSEHLLKLRNRRRGTLPTVAPSSTTVHRCENEANDDDDDDEEESEANEEAEMLEMSLGAQLVEQLINNFQNETSLEVRIPPSLPLDLKVFMPRSLAKQLYLLWMESAYNHLEEERQKIVREDEEFARLLKHPQYAEYKQSPNNLREMLDIEYAWNLYMRDKEELEMQKHHEAKHSLPKDMATHLTQIKLCENFPDIPPDTLLDILATTDNSYNETMSILRSTMKADDADMAKTQDETDSKKIQSDDHRRIDFSGNAWEYNEDNDGKQRKQAPDEAKRQALREFEEARNLAAHHCQLRAECFQKAKESIQAGNGGAGLYYSQIANLHKQKIDMYNHRAANCIMNVHKYTQNNPDHLDLHYLHMIEALECLDLFLDRHITALRLAFRNYKYIFIITGRGKHSAGGVSVIKSKVKSRLEERSLKWNEVNPGLLKVKIFSSSRHSQSFL